MIPSLAALLLAVPALAADCDLAPARALLAQERWDEARDALKAQAQVCADQPDHPLLLASAYAGAGNDFWAIRTLDAHLSTSPEDCAARAWLAWSHLRIGTADQAAAALSPDLCQPVGPLEVRTHALRAMAASSLGQGGEARRELSRARRISEAWPEDRRALPALARAVAPESPDPVAWRLDLAGGWTRNAKLGSPLDPLTTDEETQSLLGEASAWARVAPPVGWALRPTGEAQVRALDYTQSDVSGLSHVQLTGLVGVGLGRGLPRVQLGYRPDLLYMDEDLSDEAEFIPFSQAHRAEIEVEATSWLLAFAGVGHRLFSDMGRTRTEVDGGLGAHTSLGSVVLMGAVTGRSHQARMPQWELRGGTALLSARVPLPADLRLWPQVSASVDDYPRSEGAWEDPARRRDLGARGSLVLWSPAVHSARVGLSWEAAGRWSTVDAFDAWDQRLTLKLRWSGVADPWLPPESAQEPPAPWDWGLGSGEADEQLRDLVRQQDQVQSGCGCGG